jgi:hypothetical protein
MGFIGIGGAMRGGVAGSGDSWSVLDESIKSSSSEESMGLSDWSLFSGGGVGDRAEEGAARLPALLVSCKNAEFVRSLWGP